MLISFQAKSRQLRLETIQVTLGLTTLEIHSGPANVKLQQWLAEIDIAGSGNTNLHTGYDTVKPLLFHYFSRFPHRLPSITKNNDVEFMNRCKNLRVVDINWVYSELLQNTQAGDRALRLQAIYVAIKIVTFEIHSEPGNAKLQGSGETSLRNGFDAVQSLYFPYFRYFPFTMLGLAAPNNDIQLMRRCGNLRKVKLTVSSTMLRGRNGGKKTVAQLRADYRLDGMLDLADLETLSLKYYSTAALQPLKEWFESEYEKRGRGTKVVIG